MTVTSPDVLSDLVEGRTYQLGTGHHGDGVMWTLALLGRPAAEFAADLPEGFRMWQPVQTRVTAEPPNGHYRESALNWLLELGYDPHAMDLVLSLPDGVERLRP